MTKPSKKVRQALISARAVLLTCSHDTPDDLKNPARGRVIAERIEMLTEALAEIDHSTKHDIEFTDAAKSAWGNSVSDWFHE